MSKKNETAAELRAIATIACTAWRAVVEKQASTPRPKDSTRKDPVTAQDHLDRTLFAIDGYQREQEEAAARLEALRAVEAAERAEGDEILARCAVPPGRPTLDAELAEIHAEYVAKHQAARDKHAGFAQDISNARAEHSARRQERGEPTSAGPDVHNHALWIKRLQVKETELRAHLEGEHQAQERKKRERLESTWAPGATNVQDGTNLTAEQRKAAEQHRARNSAA